MFTGLVETTGTVEGFTPINGGARLTLTIPFGRELALGDSVAVNGCCLTVDALEGERISFDLLSQTLRVTSLGTLKPGMLVNLERAMSAMDRFGGHFVACGPYRYDCRSGACRAGSPFRGAHSGGTHPLLY